MDGSPDRGTRCPGGAPGHLPGAPPVKKSRTDFFNILIEETLVRRNGVSE
jgi:hypothetical protein